MTRPVPVELPARPEARDRWLNRDEAARLLRASLRSPKVRLHLPLFILLGLYTGRRKPSNPVSALESNRSRKGVDQLRATRPSHKQATGLKLLATTALATSEASSPPWGELGYVLHRDGRRIGDVKKGFEAACRRAELKGVSPHTLRHTAATWLMQQGTDLWEASGFLAMSVETLTRTYGHHHPDHMREAALNIGRRPRNVRVIT